MIAYKVLENLHSAVKTAGRQRYYRNARTYPKIPNSKLFVFKRLKDAKKFVYDNSLSSTVLTIWRVEVPNLRKTRMISGMFGKRYLNNFWAKNLGKTLNFSSTAPTGTYLTDYVQLLKEVTT